MMVNIFRLLVGITTYFIVGGIIMKIGYERNGTDIIPNKIFWFAIPGLIKVCNNYNYSRPSDRIPLNKRTTSVQRTTKNVQFGL